MRSELLCDLIYHYECHVGAVLSASLRADGSSAILTAQRQAATHQLSLTRWGPPHRTMIMESCERHVQVHEAVSLLAPRRYGFNLKLDILKLIRRIDILSTSNEIALRWMPQNLTNDTSTFIQVIFWCRQATSHYLNQCWPNSLSPYGVSSYVLMQWFDFFIRQYNEIFIYTWNDVY